MSWHNWANVNYMDLHLHHILSSSHVLPVNSLMCALKPRSNGQQYDDWYPGPWWGTARRGLGMLRPSPTQSPPLCTKCNSHPSAASVQTYYSMWHYSYLCTLKGSLICCLSLLYQYKIHLTWQSVQRLVMCDWRRNLMKRPQHSVQHIVWVNSSIAK